MSISASAISRAAYDKPVQPLFNTIYMSSLNAGIPVIVTNTNTSLRVTAKATIGSVAAGTALTDAMFTGKASGFEVDGFSMDDNKYFTLLDLESNISQLPNEFRTEAAGMDPVSLAEVLMTIGNRISEQLLDNYFAKLQENIVALVPAANVTTAQAGKIEWNPTATPAEGKKSVREILDDIISALPRTMQAGGVAGNIVTAWVSAKDFITLQTGAVEAYQYTKNGGFTSNSFQLVKEELSVKEAREIVNREFIRYKNVVILPLNGMQEDSLVVTYQQGADSARVFYEKVPAALMNNWYMVIKGAFVRNDNLTIPLNEKSQQMFFNLPYQVGNLLTINKVENAEAQYKVITTLSSGLLFREGDKVYAYLPN